MLFLQPHYFMCSHVNVELNRVPQEYSLISFNLLLVVQMGFPGDGSGKEPACQCRRCKRCPHLLHPNSWVGKIPWRRKWQPTPVFLPGNFHRQRSCLWIRKGSNMTENSVSYLVQVVTISSIQNPNFSISGCVCISVLSPYTDHKFLVSNKLPLNLVTFMGLKFHPFHLQIMVMSKM